MVSKLDKQTITCEFESHWGADTFCLVQHLNLVNKLYNKKTYATSREKSYHAVEEFFGIS